MSIVGHRFLGWKFALYTNLKYLLEPPPPTKFTLVYKLPENNNTLSLLAGILKPMIPLLHKYTVKTDFRNWGQGSV